MTRTYQIISLLAENRSRDLQKTKQDHQPLNGYFRLE